ncbi:c-type cytochrome [Nitrosophilus kaiyonis]|uniref:c-type cytochrome n=1 Tax=Nitrosophilus kaiyonis TaxID=2930200 RepID=UPI00248F7F65|nr:c-type cytochrome [Nitrosophilus kaiyonis]
MKKFLLISVVTAGLLFVGCGEKPKEEAKKSVEVKKEQVQKVEKKIEKPKEAPQEKSEKAQSPVEKVKEDIEQKVEETKKEINAVSLYAKCAGCHGSKGEKKALGKSAPIGGMDKAKLTKLIKGYKEGTLNQYGMGPLMKGQVGSLSDEEIEALSEYISKLK